MCHELVAQGGSGKVKSRAARARSSASARSWCAGVALAGLLLAGPPGCARLRPPLPGPPPELWFYQIANLSESDVVERLAPLWTRAAKAGYRRVVLADHKFGRLGDMRPAYFEHAARLRRLADSLGLAIVPGVFQIGRSGPLLAGDPNLAEALPVVSMQFEVRGGIARPHPDSPVVFPARPAGSDWGVRVGSNQVVIRRCLWRARWWYDLRVRPGSVYHVSWWMRTRDFKGAPRVSIYAGKRRLNFMNRVDVAAHQEWRKYDLMFNSLDFDSVRITLGVRTRTHGQLEWRDWAIEEAGLVNLVRRADAPLTLRDAVSGLPLVEGVDFTPAVDPLMGRDPWPGQYTAWHEPPILNVARPDGTLLTVGWHHAAIVGEKQATCCLSEAGSWVRLEDEARRMQALWGRGRYLMMIDEIRALGGDSSCIRTGLPAGAILAGAARRCAAMFPNDTLYVWSDMFDPQHNAVRGSFLVRGSLEGATAGLDSRIGVVNWNAAHARSSLGFFASRGHRQVIAGYYDGPPESIQKWIDSSQGVKGVEAILYATWANRYDDLEAFSESIRRRYR